MTLSPFAGPDSSLALAQPAAALGMPNSTKFFAIALALLLLLASFACTSGGGPAAAEPPASTALVNRIVDADGGLQTSPGGPLVNQSVIGEDVATNLSSNPGGTLRNRSGFTPKTFSGH